VIKALDGGKNVICETPMGLNVDEVKQMVAKARERKRFLQEVSFLRVKNITHL
jgi:predicted dehydrogenase